MDATFSRHERRVDAPALERFARSRKLHTRLAGGHMPVSVWIGETRTMIPAGLVLCGGESRRMGRPKAWLAFGGERMLERVVRLIATVAQPVVVVAAPNQELPDLAAPIRVVRDSVAGRGPLQGLATGLGALADSVELVYATATDVPFLEPRWITKLVESIHGHDLAIPFVGEQYHPLAALYRRRVVLQAIESLLQADRLRPVFLVEAVKTRVLSEAELKTVDPSLQTLRNLNFPADYERALLDAGFRAEEP
jgi:molybdopterin-guanine dinucleotide biosynthesis protein A